MKRHLKAGLFITFEGGEGAGKTTLIEGIARQLTDEGFEVLRAREPGGTSLGESVRSLLLHHEEPLSPYAELCLFLASRAQQVAHVIGPALEVGKIVLCDRYNDSSIVYQGVARGLGKDKVASMCDFVVQGLEPHLTLYLDIDPRLGLSRVHKERKQDRIESEGILFHEKIREGYLQIQKANPHRFHLLDAASAPAHVFEQAMKKIHPLLTSRGVYV